MWDVDGGADVSQAIPQWRMHTHEGLAPVLATMKEPIEPSKLYCLRITCRVLTDVQCDGNCAQPAVKGPKLGLLAVVLEESHIDEATDDEGSSHCVQDHMLVLVGAA